MPVGQKVSSLLQSHNECNAARCILLKQPEKISHEVIFFMRLVALDAIFFQE